NEHLPPAELTRMREHILPHIRQHGHWEGRLTMRHEATGEEIPVQMKLMEIADPGSGKPLGLAGIGHDLRAELAARERMAEREERLQSAVELARLGTWNIDLASGYISYSDRVRELYGLPESPVLLSEMRGVHPDDAAGVAADMERALRRGGEGIYDSEHRALNEGTGEIRYLHSQGRVLYDAA